ncbi:hypothetical protein [Spirochaeta thermophila]|uniref:Uncharacterized protein n=1 Tax=Winmispira thermophila (strain ATCC 49972 / DSM 6192 / RI 19.B1) TaxID=665571 RepID=E0RQP0_WINT6|nr:hypothetical protein [Spirochaeta thermophila]ADN01544.1 hypothetical protein STHERM_c05790 [Spirochaeta thermophila DSM 6192]
MKTMRRLAGFLLFLVAGHLLIAEVLPSDLYVKTVYVTKVYAHEKGYKVLYVKSNLDIGEVYIPLSWVAEKKAVIVPGNDPAFPYMSIYWKKGEFFKVILYVPEKPDHPGWGILPRTEDVSALFEVDTLQMEF